VKNKPINLRDAMRTSAQGGAPRPATPPADAPAVRRQGLSNVTGYFPLAVKRQIRMIAADREITIQRALAEALNDWFVKHGKPEAAPLD
jgi:hypothetical protein